MPVGFPTRDRKGVDSDGREDGENLGEVGERETVIRKYCMKGSMIKEKRYFCDRHCH